MRKLGERTIRLKKKKLVPDKNLGSPTVNVGIVDTYH